MSMGFCNFAISFYNDSCPNINKGWALYLLNNILGGPGLNSRLNLSLRERNGLVTTCTAERSVTSATSCVTSTASPPKTCNRWPATSLQKIISLH